jgi:D-lactate dehydratase / protein deglycase
MGFPQEDKEVQGIYQRYLPQLKSPLKLLDVINNNLGSDSKYIAVFIPGGHGAIIGIPHSEEVKHVLKWTTEKNK